MKIPPGTTHLGLPTAYNGNLYIRVEGSKVYKYDGYDFMPFSIWPASEINESNDFVKVHSKYSRGFNHAL